jgi:ubiquinone/menaquinone biosynthesis C-methylase UbiE
VDSISFDPIARKYDETRTFDKTQFSAALDYIVKRYPPVKYKELFEPGIGTGRIAIPLAERGYHVTGVDISPKMLKALAGKLSRRRDSLPLIFQKADVTALPFEDASFDIAVVVHLFHLVRNWKKAVDEVLRVLKPGAPLILMFTGSGYTPAGTKERYRKISAEYGYPIRNVGINNEADFADYITGLGRYVERIHDRWQWKQRVRLDEFFADLRAGYHTPSRHVPDDIHLMIVEKLEKEWQQRYGDLSKEVEVPNQISLILALAD